MTKLRRKLTDRVSNSCSSLTTRKDILVLAVVATCIFTLFVLYATLVVQPLAGTPTVGLGRYGKGVKSLVDVSADSHACFANGKPVFENCTSKRGKWMIDVTQDFGSKCGIEGASILEYELEMSSWWRYPPLNTRISPTSSVYKSQFERSMKSQADRLANLSSVSPLALAVNTTCGQQLRSIVLGWESWAGVVSGVAVGLYACSSLVGFALGAILLYIINKEKSMPTVPIYLILVAMSCLVAFFVQWSALLSLAGCGLELPTMDNGRLVKRTYDAFVVVAVAVAAVGACLLLFKQAILLLSKDVYGEYVVVLKDRITSIVSLVSLYAIPLFRFKSSFDDDMANVLNRVIDLHACVQGTGDPDVIHADAFAAIDSSADLMTLSTFAGVGLGVWMAYPLYMGPGGDAKAGAEPSNAGAHLPIRYAFAGTGVGLAALGVAFSSSLDDASGVVVTIVAASVFAASVWLQNKEKVEARDKRGELTTKLLVTLLAGLLGVAFAVALNSDDILSHISSGAAVAFLVLIVYYIYKQRRGKKGVVGSATAEEGAAADEGAETLVTLPQEKDGTPLRSRQSTTVANAGRWDDSLLPLLAIPSW